MANLMIPAIWAAWSGVFGIATDVLVLASVALCLARGLPVVIEFVVAQQVFGQGHGSREVR